MTQELAPLVSTVLEGVHHGFFTRQGGVSQGTYASLNAGPGSSDDPAAIAENRARVAAHLGARADRLLTAAQVHSPDALIVEVPFEGERPEADALVTATPGLAIGVLTADCAPVLLADRKAGVIAAAHAGWRGALSGVLENTLVAMERLGAKRQRITAAIGPCIGRGAYEVGPEFANRFAKADPAHATFFKSATGGRPHFNLSGFAESRLRAVGVACAEGSPACTFTDSKRFFSHRRGVKQGAPDCGRQISAIIL